MVLKKLSPYFPHLRIAGAAALAVVSALAFSAILGIYAPPADGRLCYAAARVYRDGTFLGEKPLPFLATATDRDGFVPGLYRFETAVALEGETPRAPALVFPFIAGNSFKARVNGRELGTRGDPFAGNASIWNSALVFPVPPELLGPMNLIEVEIKGVYEAGLLNVPYLVDAETHRGRLFALSLVTNYVPWALFGAAAITGAIILAAALLTASRIDGRILVGLGCFVTGILFLDYASIDFLPISFLSFKKLIVVSRHLYAALFVFTALALLKKRAGAFDYAFSGSQLVCACLALLLPGDVPALKRLYTVTYVTSIPLQPYLLYLLFRYSSENRDLFILVVGALVAFIASTLDLYNMVFAPSNPFIAHYGFSVLMMSSVVFVVRDMLSQYRSLVSEQRRSAALHEESMRDQLTGAFNRKVFPMIETGLPDTYSVVFVDLDDFKRINDTFGHGAGDEVLKHLSAAMRGNLRLNDYVVRSGGDEFLAVLPDCPPERAVVLAERVVAAAATARISAGAGAELTYTVSVGVASAVPGVPASDRELAAVIRRADAEAYRAKRAGKNRVSVEGLDTGAPERI